MVKFKSQATGDLVMVQAHARALLGKLGKSDEQGIIEVADMPAVLAVLKGLPGDEDEASASPSAAAQEDKPEEASSAEPAFADESVSLKTRAWPLIKMIERAQADGKPVVWGV